MLKILGKWGSHKARHRNAKGEKCSFAASTVKRHKKLWTCSGKRCPAHVQHAVALRLKRAKNLAKVRAKKRS